MNETDNSNNFSFCSNFHRNISICNSFCFPILFSSNVNPVEFFIRIHSFLHHSSILSIFFQWSTSFKIFSNFPPSAHFPHAKRWILNSKFIKKTIKRLNKSLMLKVSVLIFLYYWFSVNMKIITQIHWIPQKSIERKLMTFLSLL